MGPSKNECPPASYPRLVIGARTGWRYGSEIRTFHSGRFRHWVVVEPSADQEMDAHYAELAQGNFTFLIGFRSCAKRSIFCAQG